MEAIKNGELEIIYSHPEILFTAEVSTILRSDVYQELVCCIAIDEIRVITKLTNTEQSSKRKGKIHKSTNRQNQSTTLKLGKPQWH